MNNWDDPLGLGKEVKEEKPAAKEVKNIKSMDDGFKLPVFVDTRILKQGETLVALKKVTDHKFTNYSDEPSSKRAKRS